MTEIDRDKLIHTVESPDEKFLFPFGEQFLWNSLPTGTRVIYPPPPLPEIEDVDAAIDHALENPLGTDPLSAQLQSGMKVTIAFDDISLPLPPMRRPDLRQRIIEKVVEKCSENGVDDIHLIAALGLHRRMTPAELRERLGPKLFNTFHPDRLYNFDAEDITNVTLLGETDHGEPVELNRRAVECDLLVYVNINLSSMDGGHKALNTGLATYRSISNHHNVRTLMECRSYMDPTRSMLHDICTRMGTVVREHMNCFHIETTLNTATFPKFFGFLEKHEKNWNSWDKINFQTNRLSLEAIPYEARRRILQGMRAPYGMTGIHAGDVDLVHERTLANIFKQQCVPVKGQSDIVIAGLPYIGPYNVNSIMNPILAWVMSVGYCFNMYRNKPLVRQGGVLIFMHPLHYKFNEKHHPSYIEFFERVLPETRDATEMERKYEAEFACNPRYVDAYRHGYAYHGAHPFYMWYWGIYAAEWASKIIFVKGNHEAASRLGFNTAPSLQAAIEKAKDSVGQNPSISYFHWPPLFICDVE